ncbi:hypothetical protein EW146_g7783 [Bondarzewia mesenterica]|uniref:DUF8214 domain-containing protein n=1 Tax=Bondarzewia mesenterica TaxID=1095465 RepID=A0A4S4LJH3_9AGAM|nr:hypothetical protein EW146_g7783 [Bondarzewia mesenterica]
MSDYTDYMFKEYGHWKSQGKRGCMEFAFDHWEELFAAIRFIKAQPVIDERLFCGMPGSPSYAGYVPG